MLKKIATNVLLAIGTYTFVTNAPTYIGHFVYGAKAACRGEDLQTAIDKRFNS